jgi:hypothetical protein
LNAFRYLLAGGAILFLSLANSATAQDQPPAKAPPPGFKQPPFGGFQPGGGGDLISAKGLEKLALSKEQKADFDKIDAEFKMKQKELQAKVKDPKEPFNYGEIFRAQQKLRQDYLTKVDGFLTAEQKTTFKEIRRATPGGGIGVGPGGQPGFPPGGFPGMNTELISAKGLERLAFSKEQKTGFDKINDDFRKTQKDLSNKMLEAMKSDPASARESFEAIRKLRPDYLTKVEALLTDEQKTSFQEIRREAPAGGFGPGPGPDVRPPFLGGPPRSGQFLPVDVQQRLKLSDDQRKQINDLQKELEAKILKVLTEEQRRQFEEMRKQTGPPRIGGQPNPFEFQPPPELKKAPAPGLDRGGN